MRRGTWGVFALCAAAAWAQEPRAIDLGEPSPDVPEWSPLGVPLEERLDAGATLLPEERRDDAFGAVEPWLEAVGLSEQVQREGLRFLADRPAATTLERCLAPLRQQFVDRPLVRVTLVSLEPEEAARLPLGQLPEAVAAELAQRPPLARLSARARDGWISARSVDGRELLVDYEVDQNGVLPVRTPRVERVNTGAVARLRVARRADGRLRLEGVLEFARPRDGQRVSFDGHALDLPAADRLRVVGSWSLASGKPTLVVACSVPTESAYRAWGLVLQVEARPLPTPPKQGVYAWQYDVAPLLPPSYTAVDHYDPFLRYGGRAGAGIVLPEGAEEPGREGQAELEAARRLLERADFPPHRELGDGEQLYAVGEPAAHQSLATWLASRLPLSRKLRVQLECDGESAGVLRLQALRGRPACVIVGREARELVGCETLAGGSEAHSAEVALPEIVVEREGFELWLTPGPGAQLEVQGSLRAVRGRQTVDTKWGPFAQLERQRVRFAGDADCSPGAPLALGRGPWQTGTAQAWVEVEP